MAMAQYKDDYEYFMRDFKTMSGCPQCEAEKRQKSGIKGGFYAACWEVLKEPHECEKGLNNAE